MIYCKIQDGLVVDRIVFDGEMPAEWPERESFRQTETGQIGWSYDGTTFTAPAPPAAPAVVVFTYKTDVWRRMTVPEQDIFAAALDSAPSGLRGLWYDCQRLEHSAPEFPDFVTSMTSAFGAERAAVILAPS